MKKLSLLVYISLILSVCSTTMLIWVVTQNDSIDIVPDKQSFEYPDIYTLPVSTDVYLPAEMTFAGERVPLHRRDIQESLRRELIVNTYLHSATLQILKKAPAYFATIEPILKEHGVPDDFKYLAIIESNLNPLIVSPSKATSIWQFMEPTAKQYNLEVNDEVDERYHLEKSTHAAAEYLKKSHANFGSWTTAAAAYNAGNAALTKFMNLQKERNYYDLLLSEETGRYVFRILAMKQIVSHPELYNFELPEHYETEETETVTVRGKVDSWADWAHAHGISYKTLKRFNPWLRQTYLKNPKRKEYQITIPKNTKLYR